MPMSPSPRRAWAEIDLSAIAQNVRHLQTHIKAKTQILAVVKADAYGHGAVEVSQTALNAGAAWLGVAAVAEGVQLREAGITAPILLLCNPAPDEFEEVLQFRFTPMIGDLPTLHTFVREAERLNIPRNELPVHIEVDTGMGRAGVLPHDAPALYHEMQMLGVTANGLAMHFPDADADDLTSTFHQQKLFHQTRAALEQQGAKFAWVHLSNSAATLRLDHAGENLVRPGRLLYGILPPNADKHPNGKIVLPPLEPALTLKARIAVIRDLPQGHPLSYGSTYHLKRPSRIATVLIGYGDGYPRSLSNIWTMLLHGKHTPVVGRICMDQSLLDVTDIPDAKPGDSVTCIGEEGGERILAVEIAQRIGTTEHAITTRLTGRVARIIR